MFNVSNLNDYEFELLCKDIMERKLNAKLYAFSRGVDGGIDICDSKKAPKIVIQAKHYCNSKFSNLRSSLKNEIVKVNELSPNEYYVCSSIALTKNNKDEIVSMFPRFMKSRENVVDQVEIVDFLSDDSNSDIVKKHYKLWLCASNVLSLVNNQNVFIDCAELMIDIENKIKLFVETSSYFESKNKLNKNRVIIITGAPGVGKSTISNMLLLFYASEGYVVRYATDNNISDIKKALSQDPMKKEIVLLDDFLGQHYLKIKDRQPNELKTLISFVEKSPNKKLIMNSRITILNEAMQTFIVFRDIMEKQEQNKYVIDLDRMKLLEKAEILYNHIFFNNIPNEYFTNIKFNKNYFRIVNHRNYNPRIIEYVTKQVNYCQSKPEYYINYIIGKLDTPEDVWADEFRNRLDEADRILLHTLYSLSNNSVGYDELEMAFSKRIRTEDRIDTSINPFKNAIMRLTNSLLKSIEDKGTRKISVINPSINDFILSELTSNSNEQIRIVNSSQYFEQMIKVAKSEAAKGLIVEKMINEDLLKTKVLKNSAFYYFLKLTVELGILNSKIEKAVKLSFERAYQNLSYSSKGDYANIILNILTTEFIDFYCLHDSITDTKKLHFILSPMYLDDIQEIFNAYSRRYLSTDENLEWNVDLIEVFKRLIIETITDFAQEDIETDLQEIVSNVVNNIDSDIISDYMSETSNILEEIVWDKIEDEIYTKLEEKITSCSKILNIDVNDFSTRDMKYYFSISDAIRTALHEDIDYGDDNKRDSVVSEYSEVVNMFER